VIGTGTDVAVETADVVLMRSDPLDVATAIRLEHHRGRRCGLAQAASPAGGPSPEKP
jgi:hypothetical protein